MPSLILALRLVSGLLLLLLANEIAASSLFPGPKYPAGDYPNSVAVADLNGDNVPDLVTANEASDDVSVLLHLTAPPTEFEPIGSLPRSTVMLAAFQDNTCENWSGVAQPGDDLRAAVLTKADLSLSNLAGALLFNSTLTGANLSEANLQNTNLADANLAGAYLTFADLSFANLTGALYDEFTVFPSGDTYDIPPWGLEGDIEP